MKLRFDYNNMMQDSIGKEGIKPAALAKNAALISAVRETVLDNRGKGWQEWCDWSFAPAEEIDELISYCGNIGKQAESFVVLGIGGSALGPLSVASSLIHLHHNELSREKRKAPKLYVEDNVDPDRKSVV